MRSGLCVAAFAGLAACGGPAEPVWAPDAAVEAARHQTGAPPEIRLYTVVGKGGGWGAHSGLLINGRERILFDPAGTFKLPSAPERNDVHYGMSDRAVAVYIDYHADETYDVIEQRLPVSAAQAAALAQRVKAYGAVPKAQCSLSIGRILRDVPGFETIPVGYFPKRLSAAFGARPGAVTRRITDAEADKSHNVVFRAAR
ncbi:MAG: hypothetical protein OIF48_00965 [Silicimonas sp.]|nr:hypothetical protein [Silicimonas sp.]